MFSKIDGILRINVQLFGIKQNNKGMKEYKVLVGKKSHIVGKRTARVLKVNDRWLQIIILNSAWKGEYHLIFEEIEGMTSVKSEHRVVNKEELIKEFDGDIDLVEEILDGLPPTADDV